MLLCDGAVLEEEEREINKILRYLGKIADREKCSIDIGINYTNPEDPFPVVSLSDRHTCYPDIVGSGYWHKVVNREGIYREKV